MALFSEAEENKLEYMQVYQDYVLFMEKMLDVTLKNEKYGYSDDWVTLFYSTFKDNIETYKALNEDVMETLFGLVDFVTFKT